MYEGKRKAVCKIVSFGTPPVGGFGTVVGSQSLALVAFSD